MTIPSIGTRGLLAMAAAVWGSIVQAEEPDRRDIHSFGNPDQVLVKKLALALVVDFDHQELRGVATLDVERQPGISPDAPLVLDTRGLRIEKVLGRNSKHPRPELPELPFTLGKADPMRGAPLSIVVSNDCDQVQIHYRTVPKATALQWLDPPRTAGRKHPFLFTQSEAIHARSWIPLQDSPGVRITYDASVTVPEGLTAVMSADREPKPKGSNTFRFKMPQPIPSYLIALAVGDLAFRPLGPRSGVFAEPSVVEVAAHEFTDTEAMIATIEKRYGPYRWGRYDILVLPPSFPFGGMENPKLTFATPTILAGDRSLVALIAHELAHSWSGNLVTNATWRDFWLNEGFTTYIEGRVIEDLFGTDRADMEAVLSLRDLRAELKKFKPRDQVLHIDLSDRDPDDGMTRIPYEKGGLFLTTLEKTFGRDRFDAFLRGYFDHFAFQSITTADFERYLREHLLSVDPEATRAVDVRAWLHEPGLPAGYPEPSSDRFAAVDRASRDWLEGKRPAAGIKTSGWSTHEWLHFLGALPEHLSTKQMAELDAAFGLTDRGNAEIAQQWLVMAIRNRYAPAEARLKTFLTTIGRRKFLMPLYGELIKTPEGKARARAIYAEARPFYHPIAVESVDRLLETP